MASEGPTGREIGAAQEAARSSPPSEAARRRDGRRIPVLLPLALATELKAEAERQDVSVNALVASMLAGSLGWRPPPKDDAQQDDVS